MAVFPKSQWLRLVMFCIVGGVCLVGGLWVLFKPSQPSVVRLQRPEPRGGGFVGSAACTECHREVAEKYALNPKSRSLVPVQEASPIEDFVRATFSPNSKRQYRVQREGDLVFHHEVGLDREQNPIYDQAVRVRFAVGSGVRWRSYMTQQDGSWFVSPISWRVGATAWELSPGYDPANHHRFAREVGTRCVHCHAGRVAYAERAPDESRRPIQQAPFTEHAIGCERCHGPGQEHIAWHRAADPASEDPIVNPARLEPARRDAVCNQCHLHGSGHELRFGRRDDDFRPGDLLGETWSVFTGGPEVVVDGEAGVSSHFEQLSESACFRRGPGTLGCISCHDAHAAPSAETRVAFYQERCAKCHQENACGLPLAERQRPPAAGSCIACHMPSTGAPDAPHVVRTDHRIQRRPKPAAHPEPRQPTVVDLEECPLTDLELSRAQGLVLARLAEAGQQADVAQTAEVLLTEARDAAPEAKLFDALAGSLLLQKKVPEAIAAWEQALELDPDCQGALDGLAAHRAGTGDVPGAIQYLERLLQTRPWQASLHLRVAELYEKQKDFAASQAAAERSVQLDPSAPGVYRLLIRIADRRGDPEKSEEYRQLLRRIEWR